MGLWRGACRGNFLGWPSPVLGPVHPSLVNLTDRGGLGWLTGFDELLCRCGLSSNGPPGEDIVIASNGQTTRTPLTLHGKIANRPAHYVEVRIGLEPPHELTVIGHVEETGLFCPRLHLTSTCSTVRRLESAGDPRCGRKPCCHSRGNANALSHQRGTALFGGRQSGGCPESRAGAADTTGGRGD